MNTVPLLMTPIETVVSFTLVRTVGKMVRLRRALIAKAAKQEMFDFTFQRASALAQHNPCLATDYLVRALGQKAKNADALKLGVYLGSVLEQEELVARCVAALKGDVSEDDYGKPIDRETFVVGPSPGEDGKSISNELRTYVETLTKGALEVRYPAASPFGRGLYATQSFKAKTTLCTEVAAVTVPLNGERSCSHCLRTLNTKPHQCDGCADKFCTDSCRQLAMESYHAPLCNNMEYDTWRGSLHSMFGEVDDESNTSGLLGCLMASRMFGAATMVQEHPRALALVKDLRGELTYAPKSTFLHLGAVTVGLAASLRQHHLYLEDLVAMLAIVQTNDWQTEEGSLLFRGLSLVNHSCVPNAELVVPDSGAPNQRALRTVRDVRSGEQVFIDYTSVLGAELPREDRRAYLASKGVDCVCSKCARGL